MHSILEKALTSCDAAELYIRESRTTGVEVHQHQIHSIDNNKKTEVALRIIKDGKMGTAISTQVEDETLIERALVSLEHQSLQATEFQNDIQVEVQCFDSKTSEMTTEEMVKLLMELDQKVTSKSSDISTYVGAEKSTSRITLMNTSGFEGTYDKTQWQMDLMFFNKLGFRSVSTGVSGCAVETISDEKIDRLIERYALDDKPITLSNERMPVVFSGSCMGSLMMRVLAGVHAGNVEKGISPVKDKLNSQVFSNKITIRDDATLPFGCNSFKFDDEGTHAQNTLLYDKGVLKNYLSSVSQSKKLNISATGNALKRTLFSKEIEDAPSVFDTNLLIEGPSMDDDALIASIDRGLLITSVMGAHTGNINQGEFSMNISSGYLIEQGKLVGKVKGAMIAGNVYDLFKNVEALGTTKEVMHSIFYPMGYAPMVLFKEANIIGQ